MGGRMIIVSGSRPSDRPGARFPAHASRASAGAFKIELGATQRDCQ